MLYLGYIKYICQYVPFVFLQNTKFYAEDCVLVVPSSHTYYVSLFLKYSYFFKRCSLIDLGGYDMPTSGLFVKAAGPAQPTTQHTPTLWYIFKDQNGVRLFMFSLQTQKTVQQSIDLLFRNARWLEREATDFFGFFFMSKSDRRSLYTLPLFYNAPFRRKYPAVGFYELFFCPLLKKLKFKHVSLQV
jgi:NADH:ubiquinone oxidoreductase subunit C